MTSGNSATSSVVLQQLTRLYGSVHAVDHVDLDIADGEFFSLLGPSGSGKTTTLRLIAGFERPTSGRILLHGADVSGSPPFSRDVNTVFQDYALFPHLDVAGNVEYGLKVRRVSRAERRRRVGEALEVVRLSGFEKRGVGSMSGGQQQRVALARALVNRPRVLLLDEPLGALDAKLRDEMQIELKNIQRDVGITFIFVTHDQAESFAMSDRIAVFNNGRVEQVGAPEQIYENPATAFVAGFVGVSNVLSGQLSERLVGRSGSFLIRPEKVLVSRTSNGAAEAGRPTLHAVVEEVTYQGPLTRVVAVTDDGTRFVVSRQNVERMASEPHIGEGESVRLSWDPAAVVALPSAHPDRGEQVESEQEPVGIGRRESGVPDEN
jgi:putative spermidine/putrescine transport system ATP-binding protein